MSGPTCGCKRCSGRDCPENSGIEEYAHVLDDAHRRGLKGLVSDSVVCANADKIMRLATRLATGERERE